MKGFFKTTAGKFVIILLIVISLLVTSVSLICMIQSIGYSAYFQSYEQYMKNSLMDIAKNYASNIYYSRIVCGENSSGIDRYGLPVKYTVNRTDGNEIVCRPDTDAGGYINFRFNIREYDNNNHYTIYDEYDVLPSEDTVTVELSLPTENISASPSAVRILMTKTAYRLRIVCIITAIVGLALFAWLFVILMCVSARRKADNDLHPGPLNAVPFDLLAAVYALIALQLFKIFNHGFYSDTAEAIVSSLLLIIITLLTLGLCMSIAARIKQKNLLKNTVICRILMPIVRFLRFLKTLLLNLPIIWKSVLICAAIFIIDLIILLMSADSMNYSCFILSVLIELVLMCILVPWIALMLRKLEKAGNELRNGNLEYRTEPRGMLPSFRRHAENLNSISEVISGAVTEKTKSERMKTELITNVSHDIKTPLTSIINYSDLICREESENPKIREYAEVLRRQSEKLKRLTEDLIEASKAASGNLDVELSVCDAEILISQAGGEYTERLENAGLKLVYTAPEIPVNIMADSRRMWRIFDNLLGNICKYSLAGTRVYISLEVIGGNAVITFRNTSKEELSQLPEELTERFVRGDTSRTTDGNGLGLAIAKSLTELQGGSFDLHIDGDLFKITLTFPIV